jgi:transcriptional regulator GlxA family with amidase domain
MYLEQLRIEKAKELLRAGQAISKVAFDTGFADQSHLTSTADNARGTDTPSMERTTSIESTTPLRTI